MQRHEVLVLALEHVSVYAGEFVYVCACLLGLLLAHEAVQDVEGVEQEMRVHLSLELEVPVLGHVGRLSLPVHLVT